MQIILKSKNFILSLLLCAFIASGFHIDAIPSASILTTSAQDATVFVAAPTLARPDTLPAEQACVRRPAATFTNVVRSFRTGATYRFTALYLFCTLTLLSVFSRIIEKLIAFQDIRYVYKEPYVISFMHNTDGRKQLS